MTTPGAGCCGKPVGCTSLAEPCLMRMYWWKRRRAGETIDGTQPGAADREVADELME